MSFSEERCRRILSSLFPVLYQIVQVSWERFHKDHGQKTLAVSTSAAANLMYFIMSENGWNQFFGSSEVEVDVKGQRVLFKVFSKAENLLVIFRFKKLNKRKLPCRPLTKHKYRYLNQLTLGFYPEELHLIVGYLPNETWENFECYVTCPYGHKKNVFEILISGEAEEIVPKRETKPNKSITTGRLARAKHATTKRKQEGDDEPKR